MKKVVSIFLALSFLLTFANARNTSVERIDYEDGSYAIIVSTINSGNQTRAMTSDSKAYTYYTPSGQKCFTHTLYATFNYTGVSSSVVTCSASTDIYHADWECSFQNDYKSGNTAYSNATFSGPGGVTRSVSLSLTCDENGNVR